MKKKQIRALVSDFLGSLLLAMAVIGSGIMAESLTNDLAIIMFINVFSIILALAVLIATFSQIGVAHFNPIVTLWFLSRKKVSVIEAFELIVVQILGFIAGVATINFSFGRDFFEKATQPRQSNGIFVAEIIASAGLIFVLTAVTRSDIRGGAQVWVPVWFGSVIFFTSSTAFANPALSLARTFTDSTTGITFSHLGTYILAQFIGLIIGGLISMYLFQMKFKKPSFK